MSFSDFVAKYLAAILCFATAGGITFFLLSAHLDAEIYFSGIASLAIALVSGLSFTLHAMGILK